MWKFCGKAQLPHGFGWSARHYEETVFPQNFRTRKLGENMVFYEVYFISSLQFLKILKSLQISIRNYSSGLSWLKRDSIENFNKVTKWTKIMFFSIHATELLNTCRLFLIVLNYILKKLLKQPPSLNAFDYFWDALKFWNFWILNKVLLKRRFVNADFFIRNIFIRNWVSKTSKP